MSDLINEARALLDIHDAGGSPSPEIMADAAVRIAKVIADHQKVLEEIKPILRDHARGRGESHVHWKTDAGSTSVTFPEPRWLPVKGTDWDAVKAALGDRFDAYFTTRVSYGVRKDIAEAVKVKMASGGSEIASVMDAITRDEPTPRVGFRPKG
jgi:hypothetical protein